MDLLQTGSVPPLEVCRSTIDYPVIEIPGEPFRAANVARRAGAS